MDLSYDQSRGTRLSLPKKRKVQPHLDIRSIRVIAKQAKLLIWRDMKRNSLPGSTASTEAETPRLSLLGDANRGFTEQSDGVTEENEEIWNLRKIAKTLEREAENLSQTLLSSENYRKLLQAHLLGLKGSVRVYCRLKPAANSLAIGFPEREAKGKDGEERLHVMWANFGFSRLTFTCDRIFDGDCTQPVIFDEVKEYLEAALNGEQVTILAYGSKNSGKSHLLEGCKGDAGLIPRTAEFIFAEIKARRHSATLRVLVSALGLTSDTMQDLLASQSHRLSIKSLGGKVVVDLLAWREVTSPSELLNVLSRAKRFQQSHVLFQIVFEGSDISGKIIEGQINFVHLTDPTVESKGATFEAIRKVVSARLAGREGVKSEVATACRESILTRVLQDSLESPTGKILTFVLLSGEAEKASESRDALKFAFGLQSGLYEA